MTITNNISIDLTAVSPGIPRVDVMQGDTNTRAVAVTLTAGGEAIAIPYEYATVVRYRKVDGTGGTYSAMPDGSPACTIDANTVIILLAPQMLTCSGSTMVSVALSNGANVLGTFTFCVYVHADPGLGAKESENAFDYEDLSQINTAIAGYMNATAAYLSGLSRLEVCIAASTDECTDTARVYVLPDGYLYAWLPVEGEEGSYAWQNTGHAFVAMDYEDRILALEAEQETGNAKIANLAAQVQAAQEVLPLPALPDYWTAHLEEKAEQICLAVESAGRNKAAFFWYNDAHWENNAGMSPLILAYLCKCTPINRVNFGGDIVDADSGASEEEILSGLRQWRRAVRSLPNHHCVVGDHDDDIESLASEKQRYGFFFAPEESGDAVWGDGQYYYVDSPWEKTRYLYLDDSACVDDASHTDPDQCAFVIEALESAPEGWHIVVFAHLWLIPYNVTSPLLGSRPTFCRGVLSLLDACNARTAGTYITGDSELPYDFSACGAKVVLCVGGHTHADSMTRSSGGIPIVMTETDSRYVYSGKVCTPGTYTESAVSAFIVDYDAQTIQRIRIGRGTDTSITYTLE